MLTKQMTKKEYRELFRRIHEPEIKRFLQDLILHDKKAMAPGAAFRLALADFIEEEVDEELLKDVTQILKVHWK